jgi:putative DNA primase/helicase
MTEETYAEAVKYSQMGVIVHPLRGPNAKGDSPGKIPLLNNWADLREPLAEVELARHFKATGNNVGMVCGAASGVTVIDFDDMNFFDALTNGIDCDWLVSSREKHGEKIARCHLFFSFDPDLRQRMSKKFGKEVSLLGIDVLSGNGKGGGSNVVVPPSVHHSGGAYHFNRTIQSRSDIPSVPVEFKRRLMHHIALEDELYTCAKRCREWISELLGNPSILHGGDGRRCMLAMTAELKLAGLSEDGVHFLARIIYRGDYDKDRTDKELIHVKAMTWAPETLMANFPEYCNEKNTSGGCKAATCQKKTQSPASNANNWETLASAAADDAEEDHPVLLAKSLQEQRPIYFDRAHIYWAWNPLDLRYEMRDEVDMLGFLRGMIGEEDNHIYNHIFGQQFLRALQVTGRERDLQPPGDNIIQFKNGCIDINTGERFLPTPDKLYVRRVPHDLGETEGTPTIDRLFREWVGEKFARTLLEYCAYCLYDGYPIHVIFVLLGAGRNGKSQFMKLLENLVGRENVTATDLEILASASNGRFESAKMCNKKVVLMGETNFNELRNTAILKQLSGGDTVRAEFKNKPNFEFVNTAKITIATNSLPPTPDKTEGFYRRWLIIDFPNRFAEGKPIVDTIPESEYANLCRKCISVLRELLEAGEFSYQGTVEERKKRYEAKSNTLQAFIDLECVRDVNLDIPLWVLQENYEEFCTKGGHRILTKPAFTKEISELGFDVIPQKKYTITTGKKYSPTMTKDANWKTVAGVTLKKYYKVITLSTENGRDIKTTFEP